MSNSPFQGLESEILQDFEVVVSMCRALAMMLALSSVKVGRRQVPFAYTIVMTVPSGHGIVPPNCGSRGLPTSKLTLKFALSRWAREITLDADLGYSNPLPNVLMMTGLPYTSTVGKWQVAVSTATFPGRTPPRLTLGPQGKFRSPEAESKGALVIRFIEKSNSLGPILQCRLIPLLVPTVSLLAFD